MASDVHDGFWLPQALRKRVLTDATWETCFLKGGVVTTPDTPGAVAIRFPRLGSDGWRVLLDALEQENGVCGQEAAGRWQSVLDTALGRLIESAPLMLPMLAACTGYSKEMLATALSQGELVNTDSLGPALGYCPSWSVARQWDHIPGLNGLCRFFPSRLIDRVGTYLRPDAFCRPIPPIRLALGYAAGNVPGTGLIMSLLGGLANYASQEPVNAPAVLVRNSRHEPLFAPWVLSSIETVDPALVARLAVLIWDYEDETLQHELMSRAGLMLAAAGDETINALETARRKFAPGLRFHQHGHKVSFAVIQADQIGSEAARRAALDSTMWDQNGCLSARIHFVSGDADEYARLLSVEMRQLAAELVRGTTPLRITHRAFDTYASLAEGGETKLYSSYDDGFVIAIDKRRWDREALRRVVNACQGRVIIVRPVEDVADVLDILRWIPKVNLQSVSTAIAPRRLCTFADALGACGVTALRPLGRAAFPQLAYSWDGYLPLDVGHLRPAGHFTTIEGAK